MTVYYWTSFFPEVSHDFPRSIPAPESTWARGAGGGSDAWSRARHGAGTGRSGRNGVLHRPQHEREEGHALARFTARFRGRKDGSARGSLQKPPGDHRGDRRNGHRARRKRHRSEEHTSELQSPDTSSYAV